MKRKLLTAFFIFTSTITLADQNVLDIQKKLNRIQIDAGPNDGVWGSKTEGAVKEFLTYRGITFDGEFSRNEYLEIMGQRKVKFPQAKGISRWFIPGGAFPSQDTYELVDPKYSHFRMTLNSNDFDPAYSGRDARYQAFKHYSMRKQRAEISTPKIIKYDNTYTLDFDIKVSNSSAGSIFQIGAGGSQGSVNLTAYENSIRLIAGRELNNVAIFRGDWLDRWMNIRLVFRASRADNSFFRFYVNGKKTLDTTGQRSDFGFSKRGASLSFGSYRGKSSRDVSVEYKNISLVSDDLGPPK